MIDDLRHDVIMLLLTVLDCANMSDTLRDRIEVMLANLTKLD